MGKLGVGLRWSLACVVLVSGCGKTADGGAGGDGASDGERPLAGLSDEEISDVCEELGSFYDDVASAYERGICVVESLGITSDDAECEAAVEDCVDELEIVSMSVNECTEALDFRGCEATVAELNDCVDASREQVERIAALQSCEDGQEHGASEEWFDDVPACERLADRCPAAFDEPSSDVDDLEVPSPPEDTPYVIEGSVDGEAIEIHPGGSLSLSEGSVGDSWSMSGEFGGATVWLWGESETGQGQGQGLVQLPSRGNEASSWVCLDSVEVERGAEASTWKSSQLSVFPVCAEGDRLPLELTFEVGSGVSGTLQGEAVAWVSGGYECDTNCRFEFEGAGRDRWILEVDTSLEPGASKEFEHSTLIHPNGVAAVACGGGGVLTYDELESEIQIVVDALAPLSYCPGTPVEGELSGSL